MTYTALATLKILGDDFSKIEKGVILKALSNLQLSDGSFVTTIFGSENDLRFTYCAAAICHMLDDWSCIDVDKAVDFIVKCQVKEIITMHTNLYSDYKITKSFDCMCVFICVRMFVYGF